MQHTIHSEGFGVRLRPVKKDDAAFIVWLRNLEHAKGRVGDSATSVQAQLEWLEKYFHREGDYYFVIESANAIPVGAYGIYDRVGPSAESGRWIIRPDVPAALPSAFLAFETAYDQLGLEELRVRTVASNTLVLSLNRKFGFRQIKVESGAQVIGGKPVDMVHFVMYAKDWPAVRSRLMPLARLAETQVLEWQEKQSPTSWQTDPHVN